MVEVEIKIRHIEAHPGEKDKVKKAYIARGVMIYIHGSGQFNTDPFLFDRAISKAPSGTIRDQDLR